MVGDRKALKKSKLSKLLSLAIVLPVGLVLVTFFVQNRHDVGLSFWPLPLRLEIPLAAVIVGTLVVGVVWGGLASWLASGGGRRRGRDAARRAEQAEAETRRLKDQIARLEAEAREVKAAARATPAETPPALPPADAA